MPNYELETRAVNNIEVRATGGRRVTWRPIVFNERSQALGGGSFVEVIAPGSVTKTIAERDIVADYQHSDVMLLGSTRSGSLRLETDRRGVVATVELPRARDDVLELVERGDVAGGSFSFELIKEEWGAGTPGTPPVRTIREMRLHSVSLVASPAYLQTIGTVSARAELEARALAAPYGERLARVARAEGKSPAQLREELDAMSHALGGEPETERRDEPTKLPIRRIYHWLKGDY